MSKKRLTITKKPDSPEQPNEVALGDPTPKEVEKVVASAPAQPAPEASTSPPPAPAINQTKPKGRVYVANGGGGKTLVS